MKRDSDDKEWQKVKEIVSERDKSDRFLSCLSAVQAHYFLNTSPYNLISILDPAHVLAVSTHPSLTYEPSNIVMINRIAHERLDNNKSPLTGKVVSSDEIKKWWKLILGKEQYEQLIQFPEAKRYFCN